MKYFLLLLKKLVCEMIGLSDLRQTKLKNAVIGELYLTVISLFPVKTEGEAHTMTYPWCFSMMI